TELLGKVNDFSEEEKENLYYQIGMGALKYFLLKVEPKKRLLFDPLESIDFQGNTGPFIQYTHARVKSLLNKAGYTEGKSENVALTSTELEMILLLSKYPSELQEAAKAHSPATLANYLYEVAKMFNKFYHEIPPIVKEEDEALKQHRLNLSSVTGEVLKRGMRILGIVVPERM
ncbi:MAG: arginine--tRNA ligase, partial [Pedobacter sp.]